MAATTLIDVQPTVVPFRFESFGVNFEIRSNEARLLREAAEVARTSLLGDVREISSSTAIDCNFVLTVTPGGTFIFHRNGERIASGRARKKFLKFFDSMIRVSVGEYAVDRVFLHAGAVGWKGKAIIIPADSYQGKSTLVTELVRRGAEYYSDEFAVFDSEGLLHPFPRAISRRTDGGRFRAFEITPEQIGGIVGERPLPVGMILLTGYAAGKRWRPKFLTPGQAVMEMIPFTLPMRYDPETSMHVLNKIASRAIIASGLRGSAENFAKTLLNFVDKHVN